jgi:hypothetical protein
MRTTYIRFREGVSRDVLRGQRVFNSRDPRLRQLQRIIAGVIGALAVLWIIWAVLEDVGAPQAPMDQNIIYYALSTIAQCAAALAALVGFLGMWRLDRLQEEYGQAVRDVGWLLASAPVSDSHVTNITVHTLHHDIIIQAAEQFVTKHRDSQDDTLRSFALKIEANLKRWKVIPSEQQRLMCVLRIFLAVVLTILVIAVVGIPFVAALRTWPRTLTILIMLASLVLGVGPFYVMLEAAHTIRALPVLVTATPVEGKDATG